MYQYTGLRNGAIPNRTMLVSKAHADEIKALERVATDRKHCYKLAKAAKECGEFLGEAAAIAL
jgi:hypothetical protein